ncbi:MAG: nucleotide-binding domain containing protein, partial [Anaerolineales bacterium]
KILLVAGSWQELTSKQLEQLMRNLPVHVVPLAVGEDRHVRLASSLESIPAGELVVLSSASLPYLEGSEEQVAEDLAQIARRIIRAHGMEGIVLTGGATALAVCRELGAGALEIGHQALPGVPLGRILDGECQEMWVVTKAGGFGGHLALVRIVEFMRGKSIDE